MYTEVNSAKFAKSCINTRLGKGTFRITLDRILMLLSPMKGTSLNNSNITCQLLPVVALLWVKKWQQLWVLCETYPLFRAIPTCPVVPLLSYVHDGLHSPYFLKQKSKFSHTICIPVFVSLHFLEVHPFLVFRFFRSIVWVGQRQKRGASCLLKTLR